MSKRAPKFSIILAGGKGTRMQSVNLHKVCFPLDGRPAINHSIDVYKSCGVLHNIVVVGAMAGQVIETIGRDHEGIIFAYQSEQLGTAHAARQGARILKALGETEDVLIVAGDRVVEPQVLEQLFDLFYSQNCDLAFLVQPKIRSTELGRVLLYPDGAVMANVEVRDIWQRQIYGRIRSSAVKGEGLVGAKIKELIRQKFSAAKAAVAFGPLWKTVSEQGRDPSSDELLESIPEEMTRFDFTDQKGGTLILTPEEVEATNLYNSSIYLVKSEALHYVLDNLNRENAQNEEYLPDLITLLAQTRKDGEALYRVRALKVDNPHYIMAFNDPAELLEIENYFQSQKEQRVVREIPTGSAYRPISDWIRAFQNLYGSGKKEKELWTEMSRLYSEDAEFIHRKAADYLKTLEYGSLVLDPDEPVSLVRSPGRVNMMGRHVDHQGGHCNLMTIGFETLMVVHPRTDDRVCLYNLDKTRFPDRDFSIGDLVAELPWEDWISLVNSDKVSHLALSAGGDWAQYVKAGVLRLQKKFATRKLRGVDMVVHGDIPIAAGLSSSSALVVATAEAMVAVNQLDTFPSQLVNLCGEGEWFVGTRGGSADHAAIKFGQRSKIVKVTFFEFAVEDIVTFPEGYVLAVCDSGFKAQKTANAKDQFNHRVACYRIGFKLIKKLFPQYAPLLSHLRDVNIRNLGVPLSWIYKILLRLPEQTTRRELLEMLPDEDLETLFATHKPPEDGLYPIRGVVLYGLAECERSRLFADSMKAGRVEEIGRLMNVSHDGDRVARFGQDDSRKAYSSPTSNSYLLDLIEDLESGDPFRVLQAQLQWQPGAYHCSIPEIDLMVDISKGIEGVVGAQLAGAGLGGCMMVYACRDAVPELRERLTERYYKVYGKPVSIMLCQPIAGSGVLLSNGKGRTAL